MSKIKTDVAIQEALGIPKSKLIRRNRRAETRCKKAQRINAANNHATMYWLDEGEYKHTYRSEWVPETVKENCKYVWYTSPTGHVYYKRIVTDTTTIPAHNRRIRTSSEWVEREKPIIRRSWYNKKSHRVIAAKTFRRAAKRLDYTIGRGEYKRYYDLAYMVF